MSLLLLLLLLTPFYQWGNWVQLVSFQVIQLVNSIPRTWTRIYLTTKLHNRHDLSINRFRFLQKGSHKVHYPEDIIGDTILQTTTLTSKCLSQKRKKTKPNSNSGFINQSFFSKSYLKDESDDYDSTSHLYNTLVY